MSEEAAPKPNKREWHRWLCYTFEQGKGERVFRRELDTHQQQDGTWIRMSIVVWKPPIKKSMSLAEWRRNTSLDDLYELFGAPTEEEEAALYASCVEYAQQGLLYWSVACTPGCTGPLTFHPLAQEFWRHHGKDTFTEVGGIVADNACTRTILEHLQRTDEEWRGSLGSDDACAWRSRLITCIGQLYD